MSAPLRSAAIAAAALAGLLACQTPDPATGGAAVEEPASKAVEWTRADRDDPGPRLKRQTGPREALARAPVTIEVDAIEVTGTAVFLRVPVPADPSRLVVGPVEQARVRVLGDRPGLAVPAFDGRLPDRPWLYARLAGSDPPPPTLELDWDQPASLDGEPGQTQRIKLTGLDRARSFDRLSGRALRTMSRWFTAHGALPGRQMSPFWSFAGARLSALRDAPDQKMTRRVSALDLMNVAPDRALSPLVQTDRGARAPVEPPAGDPIPITQIVSVPAAGHPWASLLQDVETAPEIDALARFTPAEWWYVKLGEISAAFELWSALRGAPQLLTDTLAEIDRGQPLAVALDRLGLDAAFARSLTSDVARAGALVGSDAFITFATDVTLLIHAADTDAVEALLTADAARWKTRRADAQVRTRSVGGTPVERLWTPTGDLERHRARLGDTFMVSNSAPAIERVLAAAGGERPLTDDLGFKYARSQLPQAGPAGTEVAFAYVGDGFLNRQNLPQMRILHARRQRALGDLAAVEYALMLHGWLRGEPVDPTRPEVLAEAEAIGVLTAADLRHDDGTGISIDRRGVACSTRWGCTDRGRPLIEMDISEATAREAGAYGRLRETYGSETRRYVAPIAFGVRADGDVIELTGRLGPLPRFNAFSDLADLLGSGRIDVLPALPGVAVGLTTPPDAALRKQLDEFIKTATGQRDVGLSWLGEKAVVGFADQSGLWDSALSLFEIPDSGGRRRWRDPSLRKSALGRLPLYVVASIADPGALATTLAAAKAFTGSADDDALEWSNAGRYRSVEVTSVRERLTADPSARVGLLLGVAGDALVIALDDAVFETVVDAVLDGKTIDVGTPMPAVLSIRPLASQSWLIRGAGAFFEMLGVPARAAARRSFEGAALGLSAKAARRYGVAGAHGRRFALDDRGRVAHPLYGTEVAPDWPALPVPDSPIGAWLARLVGLEASVAFEGKGLERTWVTTVRWHRRR